jgi:hypothetical protein
VDRGVRRFDPSHLLSAIPMLAFVLARSGERPEAKIPRRI